MLHLVMELVRAKVSVRAKQLVMELVVVRTRVMHLVMVMVWARARVMHLVMKLVMVRARARVRVEEELLVC